MTTWKNRIPRRDLLKFGAAAFAMSSMGVISRAGAAGETPVQGGILTLNFPTDPPNFDVFSNSTSRVVHVVTPCCNRLVTFDPAAPDTVIGDLAESWTVSEDGKTYEFKLLKGVSFHDGAPFTSADVKFTFDTMRNPKEGAVSVRKASLSMVDSIEAPDEYTVRFILKQKSPAFLAAMASGWMVVLPKHILEKEGHMRDQVIGTGPFRLKAFNQGVSVELERNPNYHIPDRPYLDGITFYIIKDPSTAFAYFRTGQLLIYDNMTGEDGRRATAEFGDTVKVLGGPGLGYTEVSMSIKRKPWDDLRMRQAVSLAISREEALKVLYQGNGTFGGLMPPGFYALPPEVLEKIPGYGKDRAANLAEAKRLMAEAGFPNGLKTTLTTRRNASTERVAIFVQDQLKQVGIETTIDLQEDAIVYDNFAKHNFDIGCGLSTAKGHDPDAIFGEAYTCDAGNNYSGVCIPELDELFKQQSQETDPEVRKQIVQKMEKMSLEEISRVMLLWRFTFHGHSNRVKNFFKYTHDDDFRQMQDVWLTPA